MNVMNSIHGILSRIWLTILAVCVLTAATVVSAFGQTPPITAEQIDVIAAKSDRWLFIAALVLLLGFGALVVKWLLTQLDRQREASAAATDKLMTHLQADSLAAKMALEKNTAALDKMSELLKDKA